VEECRFSRLIAGTMTWGAWGKQLNKNQMNDLIHHCISQNITTFDHADIYGGYSTEAEFGNAFAESGVERTTVQIISKCGIQLIDTKRKTEVKHYNYNKSYITWSVEQSLKKLKTDYLDLLLLHRPSPLMEPEDIAEAITELIDCGKIKSFGVSNFTVSQMELLLTYLDVSANQIECSLTAPKALNDGTLDYLCLNNMTTMAWSPLGDLYKKETKQTVRIHNVLNGLCEKYQTSKNQLLLAWLLKHPANLYPVLGTTTPDRITKSAEALQIHLDLQDWFKMWEASLGNEVP